MRFGAPHRHFARTDSTNTRARELAATGAPGGTVVTAAEQTAGHGRQGRSWTAPPGGALLYSAILRPLDERHLLLPLAAPLAVCAAAEELRPRIECGVKWPNDVHLEGRKLAGILVEARPQDGWAVIGVGLNLTISTEEFPADLRDTATSLFEPDAGRREDDTGRREDDGMGSQGDNAESRGDDGMGSRRDSGAGSRGDDYARRREDGGAGSREGFRRVGGGEPLPTPLTAAATLSRHLGRWVAAGPDEVLAAWRARDVLRGREVAWEGGSGVADGVDDRGFLLVLTAAGERLALGAGEVHLRL